MAYNRYSNLIIDGEVKKMPFVKLPIKFSDKEEIYKVGITRIDLLSDKFYKDPNYGWLIMLANSDISSLEFNIPDNAILRIPYPLETSLNDFQTELLKYIKYYGV